MLRGKSRFEMNEKPLIRSLNHRLFVKAVREADLEKYSVDVLKKFLFKIGITNFDEVTTFSKNAREWLNSHFDAGLPKVLERLRSKNETIKLLLDWNGAKSESVLMNSRGKRTACISVQSGCKLNCVFCATGKLGFFRNLSFGEILDQVLILRGDASIDRIVVMGMGEPMDNLDEVIPALHFLTSKDGYGYSRKRITLSTVGIVPGIERLADSGVGVELAISLHAVDDNVRSAIIPMNSKYNIEDVLKASKLYASKANSKVTIEYLLLQDINNSEDDAVKLGRISRKYLMPINLIVFNPTEGIEFEPADNLERFTKIVSDNAIAVTVRRSKGKEISAACGQLVMRGA